MSKRLKTTRKVISLILRVCATFIIGTFVTLSLWHSKRLEANDIILIAFFIILVLADSFSSFSIGNIISLKKDVKENKKEIEVIKKQILSFFENSNNNQMVFQQYFGNEPVERFKSETEKENVKKSGKETHQKINKQKPIFELSKEEKKCLAQYATENEIAVEQIDVSRRITFPNGRSIICDGFFHKQDEDIFIEIQNIDSVLNHLKLICEYINLIENYNRLGRKKAFLQCLIYSFESLEKCASKISAIKEKYKEISQYLNFNFYFFDKKD